MIKYKQRMQKNFHTAKWTQTCPNSPTDRPPESAAAVELLAALRCSLQHYLRCLIEQLFNFYFIS